jgi:hypothetical protein
MDLDKILYSALRFESRIYRVIQEESQYLRGDSIGDDETKVNMCLIVNGYRDRLFESPEVTVICFFVGWIENEVYKGKVTMRRIACPHFGYCGPHEETRRSTQTKNTQYSHMNYKEYCG